MNRISDLRKKSKLNQTILAKKIGVSQSTLSYWERGDFQPDNENLIKLADFFNVTTDYLLGRTNDPTPTPCNSGLAAHESKLLHDYKALSPQGQEYIRQTMVMAINTYGAKKDSNLPDLEVTNLN